MSAIEHLLRTRLDPLDVVLTAAPPRSDNDLNPDWDEPPPPAREAAVLAPIIKRAGGWTMLLTERSHELAMHSGQVAFPGGRMDATDASPLATALRETQEEVGIARDFIEPIGAWDRYRTITGYHVTPIAALVEPGFTLTTDPREVASVFETPLDFLMNPANHEKREAEFRGRQRFYWAMPYDGHFIWGATAGMIRALYERLYLLTTSIAHAAWFKAPETRALMVALEAARAGGARFVGGCVRNTLMGRDVDDIDIATQLTPDQVTEVAQKAGFAAHPTGIEHGTMTVVVNHHPFEVTTLRRDVSTDGRRATVAFTESWEEDAQRRDFRLNALYADPAGEIHDPTGGGLDDVRAGRVIFIGDAHTRLREDYLRILRFFRFNAWYAKGPLDPQGLQACADEVQGLDGLSTERVWKEAKKLLGAYDPRAAWEGMEAIEVRVRALPEMSDGARLRALMSLEADLMLPIDAMTRVAAALSDQEAAKALARRLKLSNEERDRLIAALGDDVKITSYMSLREMRRAIYAIGNEAFRDRVMLAWAAAGSDKAQAWRALITHAQVWAPPKLPLTGGEVMAAGVPAGPKVGAVMPEVEAWWIDADFPDDKLSVIERLKAVAQGMT